MYKQNRSVSIALATYNGGNFLREQLNSLINQSYRNIEIIISDDCSSDDTLSICKEFADIDHRIRLETNITNIGFNKNFEKAVSLCSGDLIAISDQDDIWLPYKIEKMLDAWEDDTLLMHHGYKEFTSKPLPPICITNEKDMRFCTDMRYIIAGNFITGCTTLFKKDLLESALPFPETVIYDWWLGVCAYNMGKVQFLYENLIYHRRHDTSAHFSIERSRRDHLAFIYNNTQALIDLNAFNEKDRLYAEKTVSIYRRLLNSRFSWKAFLWFYKTRNRNNFV